jgi:hypothetical protein
MSQQQLDALTHGWNGLILGYATVLIAMLVGLRQRGAPVAALLRGPLLAIPVTVVAAAVVLILTSVPYTFGVDGGPLLQFVFDALICMEAGYIAGCLIAGCKRSPDATYRRGAIVTGSHEAGGSRQQGKSAAAATVNPGNATPGPLVTPSSPQPGASEFAKPPTGAAGSIPLPYPVAYKKRSTAGAIQAPGRKRTRKPTRGIAIPPGPSV